MGVAKRKRDRRLEVFEDTHAMWTEKRLTQARAAELPGVCERTFRHWVDRRREDEAEGGGVETLRDLGIDLIPAYSPEARVKVRRHT